MRRLLTGLVLAAALTPGAQAQSPSWMTGCWESRSATGISREEWRSTPTGLDGGAVTLRGDTLIAWEFLRVATADGRAAYHAAPNGQAPHTFPLLAASADSVIFGDPAHDFPQRITYRRRGADALVARVEGRADGQSRGTTIDLRRVPCDPARDLTTAVALRERLGQMLDSLRALGRAPGLSAAVTLPDGRTITVVSGLADSTDRRALQPTDRLLAGSVGKTFFAALALNLVAEGRLDLDAKISRWLGQEPWFARLPNGADITVRQLMNHTSGLVRYEFDPAFARDVGADPARAWVVADQVAYILGKPAPFAAGTSWEYSDTNYLVLALILERITGEPAYDTIRRRFLTPLRLRGTVPSTSTRIERLVNGYGGTPDPLGMSGPMLVNGALKLNPQFEWAGGGYASTPEDLARWTQAWHDGRVIPSAVLAQAHDGVAARGLGGTAKYGLGVIIRDSPRGITYGHSGFFPGYLTEVRYYPDAHIAVAVQANTSDQRAIGRGLAAIAHALADRAMGPVGQ